MVDVDMYIAVFSLLTMKQQEGKRKRIFRQEQNKTNTSITEP
jgi:hypothetical protein